MLPRRGRRCWSRCPPPLMLLPRLGRRCWHRRPNFLVPRLTRPPREALQPRPAVLQQSATATAAATTAATGSTASHQCLSPTTATATGWPARRAANPARRQVAIASATRSAAASCPTPPSDRAPTPADLSRTWEAEHPPHRAFTHLPLAPLRILPKFGTVACGYVLAIFGPQLEKPSPYIPPPSSLPHPLLNLLASDNLSILPSRAWPCPPPLLPHRVWTCFPLATMGFVSFTWPTEPPDEEALDEDPFT